MRNIFRFQLQICQACSDCLLKSYWLLDVIGYREVLTLQGAYLTAVVGGLTYKGKKMKVKILTVALSNPRSLVMICSEQFLFLL